jgi:hypothetical protein
MLSANFSAMVELGDDVLKPFLQDVIQLKPLLRTMAAQVVQVSSSSSTSGNH